MLEDVTKEITISMRSMTAISIADFTDTLPFIDFCSFDLYASLNYLCIKRKFHNQYVDVVGLIFQSKIKRRKIIKICNSLNITLKLAIRYQTINLFCYATNTWKIKVMW